MASIQVLELHPVEAQIEELSYDMTDSILGGFDVSAAELAGINSRLAVEIIVGVPLLQAVANFWKGFGLEGEDDNNIYDNYPLTA